MLKSNIINFLQVKCSYKLPDCIPSAMFMYVSIICLMMLGILMMVFVTLQLLFYIIMWLCSYISTVFVLIYFTYLPKSQNQKMFYLFKQILSIFSLVRIQFYLSRASGKWVSTKSESVIHKCQITNYLQTFCKPWIRYSGNCIYWIFHKIFFRHSF